MKCLSMCSYFLLCPSAVYQSFLSIDLIYFLPNIFRFFSIFVANINEVFDSLFYLSSVQLLNRVRLFTTPRTAACQASCPSRTPGVCTNSSPLSRWCHPTISSSVIPFSFTFNLSQHQGLFKWFSSLHQVAKVLEFQLQHQSFQWTLRTDLL